MAKNPTPRAEPGDTADASMTYETMIERVERIADRIERGEIGLEASFKEYEEASALLKRCRAMLDDYERRFETLRDADEADGEPED